MKLQRKIVFLFAALAGIVILPYLGTVARFGGKLPPNFFYYPPIYKPDVAPFNEIVFGISIAICLFVALVYIMPGWFGFKKNTPPVEAPVQKVKFPIWFWLGLVLWGVPVILLWSKATQPITLLHYSDLPLFWGFTFLLDGLVYKRSGGRSIIADNPREMIGIGSASVSGWMIFEFLNFFIGMNWYYPHGGDIDSEKFLLYALIGSSGLLPMAFEWYDLLLTFKPLKHRFDTGVKVNLSLWVKALLIVAAFVTLYFMGRNPAAFFSFIWISPLIILSIVLGLLGVWTPFRPLKQGNWSPFLLFALAYLLQGLAMEGWNYFSGTHNAAGELIMTQSPAYWVYNIPYVYKYRIFEMPLVGYVGYLPFSVWCWIWWIMYAYLQGIPTRFYDDTEIV